MVIVGSDPEYTTGIRSRLSIPLMPFCRTLYLYFLPWSTQDQNHSPSWGVIVCNRSHMVKYCHFMFALKPGAFNVVARSQNKTSCCSAEETSCHRELLSLVQSVQDKDKYACPLPEERIIAYCSTEHYYVVVRGGKKFRPDFETSKFFYWNIRTTAGRTE